MSELQSLLIERELTEGQLQCENAKSRGWSAKRVNDLNALLKLQDEALSLLGHDGPAPRSLMGLGS